MNDTEYKECHLDMTQFNEKSELILSSHVSTFTAGQLAYFADHCIQRGIQKNCQV